MAAQAGNGDPGDRADKRRRNPRGNPIHQPLGSYPFTVTPESRPPGRRYVTNLTRPLEPESRAPPPPDVPQPRPPPAPPSIDVQARHIAAKAGSTRRDDDVTWVMRWRRDASGISLIIYIYCSRLQRCSAFVAYIII